MDEYVEQIKDEITKALDKVAPIQTKRKILPQVDVVITGGTRYQTQPQETGKAMECDKR